MTNCNHFWVARDDGYEEQCRPAICLYCGEYGCYCYFQLDNLKGLTAAARVVRIGIFEQLGVPGNNHELERQILTKE